MGCRVRLPDHVAGAALWGVEGCPSNPPPPSCPNKNSPSKHTRTSWLAGMVCAANGNKWCVCVLLGVCSSNKGKRCVLHCLIRHQAWLCSALSACLISVHVSVRSAMEQDGSQPLDRLRKSAFWKDFTCTVSD